MELKIIYFLSFVTFAKVYGDLLGQNRLGNNRLITGFRLNLDENPVLTPDSLLLPIMMEFAKTADGRKLLKSVLRIIGQKKRRKFSQRYVRRFWAFDL